MTATVLHAGSPAAVLLDMDGTLLDTEGPYEQAFFSALDEFGLRMSLERYRKLVGHGTPARRAILVHWYGTRFPLDRFLARYRELREARMAADGVALRSGAMDLLSALGRQGVGFAIVTSASRRTALLRLGQAGVETICRVLVSRDDVIHPKPHPESFVRAAALLSASPANSLALEDSTVGAQAAQQAGMQVVVIGLAAHAANGFRLVRSLTEVADMLGGAGAISFQRNSQSFSNRG